MLISQAGQRKRDESASCHAAAAFHTASAAEHGGEPGEEGRKLRIASPGTVVLAFLGDSEWRVRRRLTALERLEET